MGQIKFIDRLPQEVRIEFNKLVVSKNYKDCEYLALWLKDKGYITSKSAVHRYISESRGKLSASISMDPARLADMRLRALELSVIIDQDSALDAIKHRADNILKWAFEV